MEFSKPLQKTKIFLEMIKFEHTIFALPFAYSGALLGALWRERTGGGFITPAEILWITLAMVGARTAAMSLNRVIDRHIDARNPRTSGRAIPRGLISLGEAWFWIILSFGLLFLAAYNLNPLGLALPLPAKLFPVAVLVLVFYSYTKRFTWLCHLVLGSALALAPLGAWIAVTGGFALPPILLALAVVFWVAGFDIIYAIQDYDFDRSNNIYSIPARFGIKWALRVARAFHMIMVIFLVSVGLTLGMGLLYWLGVAVASLILIHEHRLISPWDLSKIDMAFFNLNGILSVILFLFTLGDIILGRI